MRRLTNLFPVFTPQGLTSTFLGFDLASRHTTLYSYGLATFNATTLPTVARAVANALLLPASASAHNRFFCIAELRTRQIDVLAALKRETVQTETNTTAGEDRPWVVVGPGRDAEEMRAEGSRRLKEGGGVVAAAGKGAEKAKAAEAAEMLILGDLFGRGVGTVGLERVRLDNRVLGVEMRDVGDVVRECLFVTA